MYIYIYMCVYMCVYRVGLRYGDLNDLCHLYIFTTLTNNGPAKFIQTLEKGAASLTRKSGKSAACATLHGFPSDFVQITLLLIVFFTICLHFTTQYFVLSLFSAALTPQ